MQKSYARYRRHHGRLPKTTGLAVNENANVNFRSVGLFFTTLKYYRQLLAKNIYPAEVADAHRSASFHIHDLSMFLATVPVGLCASLS